MARKYLGKSKYVCKIVTTGGDALLEIISDWPVEPKIGDVVRLDGSTYRVYKVNREWDFDHDVLTRIVQVN